VGRSESPEKFDRSECYTGCTYSLANTSFNNNRCADSKHLEGTSVATTDVLYDGIC
jgi:hypothetical protein